MNNQRKTRRTTAYVSLLGTTQIHLRNPYVVAWWSAAFPGFGHLLLSKYLRGFSLFIWEVVVNTQSNINFSMIYSFEGKIQLAKDILDTRWLLIYIPVYIFAIWDSYRTTVDLNRIYVLAQHEDNKFSPFKIGAMEINYLDKRSPLVAFMWSLFAPGLGQLYVHRIVTAFFVIVWSVVFFYYSHALEAIILLFQGDIQRSTDAIRGEWLLFFPSLYGFAVFDAYMNTIENNKLFEIEQRHYLRANYQCSSFKIQTSRKKE
ncbi:hypothetical protein [Priestia koreensis]|uniref:Uncharacterized protein n=1 Tax=Priestia koreensis TaxID=284581 RepID=A0A0M0KWX6_9BACI|nr:hypothetical protein [Priestia koreensis]KOO42888.1 hypothetical protein AMD01_17255 [Priestia koreensis]